MWDTFLKIFEKSHVLVTSGIFPLNKKCSYKCIFAVIIFIGLKFWNRWNKKSTEYPSYVKHSVPLLFLADNVGEMHQEEVWSTNNKIRAYSSAIKAVTCATAVQLVIFLLFPVRIFYDSWLLISEIEQCSVKWTVQVRQDRTVWIFFPRIW